MKVHGSEFLIRAAGVEDAAGLTALMNLPGYRYGTLRLPLQPLQDTKKALEKERRGFLHLVALLDDMLVGAANFTQYDGRRSHCAFIGTGVHDDHVGKGIGTALMAALIDAADNWYGLKRLELTVFTDNARAIRLYERFGFEREGILRAYAFRAGEYADALSMARVKP